LHEVKQIIPPHQVKCLLDVKLEEDGWSFGTVKPPNVVSNTQEVVVNNPSFDEGTLRCRNDGVHVRS
jgi:hypothetical protein